MFYCVRVVLRPSDFQKELSWSCCMLQHCPNHLPEDPRNVKIKGPRASLYEKKKSGGMKQTQNLNLCTLFFFNIEQFQCRRSPNLAVKFTFLFKYIVLSVSTWGERHQASRGWKWKDTMCLERSILMCLVVMCDCIESHAETSSVACLRFSSWKQLQTSLLLSQEAFWGPLFFFAQ